MQDANPVCTFSKGRAGPRCSAFGVDSAPVPGTRSLEPGTGFGITSSGPSLLSRVPSDRLRPNLCLTRPAPSLCYNDTLPRPGCQARPGGSVLGIRPPASIRYRVSGSRCQVPGTGYLNGRPEPRQYSRLMLDAQVRT